MESTSVILATVLAFVAGGAITRAFVLRRLSVERERERAAGEHEAGRVLARAEQEAENLRRAAELEGRDAAIRLREAWEKEEDRRREELRRAEHRAQEREDKLDRTLDRLETRDAEQEESARELAETRRALAEREAELTRVEREVRDRLESLAGLSRQEARDVLRDDLLDEARAEAANQLREIRDEARRSAEREAHQILATSIQRQAAETTAELTVSVVQLPSDEMKGRIIGREGRNIRSFEHATGIDVVIDDTPEAVVLSGFNPIRREIARVALSRLVEDGRIHPARIEEVVERAKAEVESEMTEAAEAVLYDLGVHNVHPEIVRVLGRLRFRTSYGQNQLQHSREVARLAGAMALEIGADEDAARRAGILHDVGKGLTDEQEGTHVELGYRLCKRHGEGEIVLNAIRAHHDEEPHYFVETFLVTAADAVSGSRPGARREVFDGYVKRLEKLESIALQEEGVERCFAIQAGRELRVMVQPDKVSDAEMAQISASVAERIQSELQYPGQIKVVVVRETRAVDFAR
ncbi:MAG: ribonuclease Y [Longimicrobiales bacterium]|nr:ribonuclease Y [Longimicrobiales bacterium]